MQLYTLALKSSCKPSRRSALALHFLHAVSWKTGVSIPLIGLPI